ncbi:hypothetical protein JK188_11940 [Providencia sp. JGM181]|nr:MULTISPECIES: hypothetical protein [Providencia]MBS0925191.1 hypothetical protein [Providencia sp. JGM181]MBG5882941.1 hypothetical protein [Providencia alcalifaciens]MBS0933382.1 hypothetical protein [Providencia sp. JGM172]MBS0998831.1 hypothetical protein [Providencia sp. JGM178]MDR2990056.1 hypothetical protein [Providencia alcalifaciens]
MIHNLLNNSIQPSYADRRVTLAFTFLSMLTSSRSYRHTYHRSLMLSQ